jgi:acid phosphatase family membrane protein YuiD
LKTSGALEEGANSSSWPNGHIIVIIIMMDAIEKPGHPRYGQEAEMRDERE